MRELFEEQLLLLNQELTEMGALCEEIISLASQALVSYDKALGEKVSKVGAKIDEEERARTQATEEYRQKAQADKAAKAKQMEEQAMEDMRHDVDEFAQAEKARAEGELAAQAKRKQQILDQLDQQLQKNKDAWVDTILTRVLGGGQ